LISIGTVGASTQHATKIISSEKPDSMADEKSNVRNMIGNVRIIDTIGWSAEDGKHPYQAILNGNIQHGWKINFNEMDPDDKKHSSYLLNPGVEDMIHGLIILVSAEELIMYEDQGPVHERLKKAKADAEICGVDPILLITKVDSVDFKLKDNYSSLYESEDVCTIFNNVHNTGFTLSNTFVAQLYHTGVNRKLMVENTALLPFAEVMRRAKLRKQKLVEKLISTPPTSDKILCPYSSCPFQDADHLRDYLHKATCSQGSQCKLIKNGRHTNVYLHPCSQGLECLLVNDSKHANVWSHTDNKTTSSSTPSAPIPGSPKKLNRSSSPTPSDDDQSSEGQTPGSSTSDCKPFTAKEAQGWNADYVLDWLTTNDLTEGNIKSAFLSAKIKGKRLLTLDDEDLQAMGITERFHRRNILAAIQALKES